MERSGNSEGISVVGDERLTAFTVAPEAGRAVIQAYSDDTRERYIAARIGENGPVLATQKVSGIGIYSSNSTYVAEVEQYEDGTRLYEMLVVKTEPEGRGAEAPHLCGRRAV